MQSRVMTPQEQARRIETAFALGIATELDMIANASAQRMGGDTDSRQWRTLIHMVRILNHRRYPEREPNLEEYQMLWTRAFDALTALPPRSMLTVTRFLEQAVYELTDAATDAAASQPATSQ